MRHRYSSVFLHWLHHLQPAVQQPVGGLCEGLQMNDDDDFFIDALKTLFGAVFVVLIAVTVGFVVWELIA
jgi:hypothetical protein